jgi:hypothetical protein
MAKTAQNVLFTVVFLIAVSFHATAQDLAGSVCRVAIYDETSELEDSKLAVELARSRFEAFEKIFKMIEGLWEGKAIPRMDYVKAKYDQDAARLQLDKSGLLLERQGALVQQYRLICRETEGEKADLQKALWEAYLHYRRADCEAQAKGVEVAETNLTYNREYLENILRLRSQNFATQTQVIMAELDVELEEKSLEDAKQRTSVCREATRAIEEKGMSYRGD